MVNFSWQIANKLNHWRHWRKPFRFTGCYLCWTVTCSTSELYLQFLYIEQRNVCINFLDNRMIWICSAGGIIIYILIRIFNKALIGFFRCNPVVVFILWYLNQAFRKLTDTICQVGIPWHLHFFCDKNSDVSKSELFWLFALQVKGIYWDVLHSSQSQSI